METKIEVIHPNGYKGVLYGHRSMSVLKDNQEIMHTGFRSINTEKELYDFLESFPNFIEILRKEVEKDVKD